MLDDRSVNPTRSTMGASLGIAAFAAPFVVTALVVTIGWHDAVRLGFVPRPFELGAGAVLLLLGLALYAVALPVWLRGIRTGRLITTGAYALCRNPLYAAWILFLVPGLGLLLDSWPIVMLSFVVYAGFKLLVGREYLEFTLAFGPAYRRYEASVPELLPIPRRRAFRRMRHV